MIETRDSLSKAYATAALPVVLAVSVAISSTTGVGVGHSWFDEQRIIWLVVLAATALVSAAGLVRDASWSGATIVAALALGLASACLSKRPLVAATDWAVYCLMAVLITSARPTAHRIVGLTATFAASAVATAYTTGVVANYVSSLALSIPLSPETLLVGFSNPRFPAQLQALTLPFLPLAFQFAPKGFWRGALVAVAAIWYMCLVGSGSRTAWIALASASFVLLAFGETGRRWIKVQAGLAATGFMLWVLLFTLVPSLLEAPTALESGRFSNFTSVGSRRLLWTLSTEAALQHPFLGIGPMHFAYFNNHEGAHPHNFWLQLAAEWGIPAAILLGCTAVVFFVRLARAVRLEKDPARQSVGLALLAAVTAWGVGTLADGYMVVPTSQAMSTMVLMLAAMWLRQTETHLSGASLATRFPPYLLAALCCVALSVLAVLPFSRFGNPTAREIAWRAEHPGDTVWPRFWQHGWIGPGDDVSAREAD